MKDIKKALLLMMIGGVSKQMQDGMKIRGNINILLMVIVTNIVGRSRNSKESAIKVHITHITQRYIHNRQRK
jgi:hypothetical protein